MSKNTLTVTRELRNSSHWVHVTGPEAMFSRATYACGVEARKWARELGTARAFRVSGGASFNGPESGGPGTFRYSVSYGFEDK
jgi:hypothetical protein